MQVDRTFEMPDRLRSIVRGQQLSEKGEGAGGMWPVVRGEEMCRRIAGQRGRW